MPQRIGVMKIECLNRKEGPLVTKGVILGTEGTWSQMSSCKNGIRLFSQNHRIQKIIGNIFKNLRKLFLNVLEFCSQSNEEAEAPNILCLCLSPGGNFMLPLNNMYSCYSQLSAR